VEQKVISVLDRKWVFIFTFQPLYPHDNNDARFTLGCVDQTYSGGDGEEKYFASAENRITTL
jgi:hypothetical protein